MSTAKIFEKRRYFRLWDLALVAVVVFVAAACIFATFLQKDEGGLVAVIKVDGKLHSEIELAKVEKDYDLTISVEDGELVLSVSKDGVCVKSSPCADKLCVNTGMLTKSGQGSVCLPERVSVKLRSSEGLQSGSDIDAVVG